MERPMGCKKAKAQKMQDKIEAESMQSTVAMEAVALSSSEMVKVISKRQRHDSWSRRADLYLRMGNMEMAQEMIDMMANDDVVDRNAVTKAAIPEAIEWGNEKKIKGVEEVDSSSSEDDDESKHSSQPSDDSLMVKKPKNIEQV